MEVLLESTQNNVKKHGIKPKQGCKTIHDYDTSHVTHKMGQKNKIIEKILVEKVETVQGHSQ